MTVGKARIVLLALWMSLTGVMTLILATITLFGRYADKWDMPWNWFLPLVFPTAALIVAIDLTSAKLVKSPATFWLTVGLSVVYFAIIYGIVLLHPFSESSFETLMRASGWFLGPLQGLVCAGIAKIFLEVK